MTSVKKKIYFHQCDPAGILFFGEIFSIAHSAFEDFLSDIGIAGEYFALKINAFPIISASAQYLKPLKHNDEITVDISLKEIGTTSFQLLFQVYNTSYEISAEVNIAHVCVNAKTFRKSPLTKRIKTVLEEL